MSPPSSILRGSRPVYDGIGVFEIDLLRVRQLDDVELVHGRAHAGGFDHVIDRLGEIEQHAFVGAVLGLDHRHALERARRSLANQDGRVGGVETRQRGVDHLIGALGHRGVARLHLDAIRRRRFDVARDDEDRRQRVTEIRRAEREQRDRRRPRPRRRPTRSAASARARCARLPGSRARARWRSRPGARSAPATSHPAARDTSMALRIVESSVGSCSSRYSATCSSVTLRDSGRAKNHAPAATSTSAGDDAEPEDRGGRELQRFERVGDRENRDEPGEQESDRAAQRELDAPAPADLPDHFEQLRAGIDLTHCDCAPGSYAERSRVTA